MLVFEAVVSWVSCAQNDSLVVGDISARSVMRTADFPFGTTGKNTADVKKPMSEMGFYVRIVAFRAARARF